jgi:hypothetical protein
MNRHLTPVNGTPRRRRAARPLPLYTTLPEPHTSAAMDDAAAAEQLIADLLALVDAGLVAPAEDAWGDIRYAAATDDDSDEPHQEDGEDGLSAA